MAAKNFDIPLREKKKKKSCNPCWINRLRSRLLGGYGCPGEFLFTVSFFYIFVRLAQFKMTGNPVFLGREIN